MDDNLDSVNSSDACAEETLGFKESEEALCLEESEEALGLEESEEALGLELPEEALGLKLPEKALGLKGNEEALGLEGHEVAVDVSVSTESPLPLAAFELLVELFDDDEDCSGFAHTMEQAPPQTVLAKHHLYLLAAVCLLGYVFDNFDTITKSDPLKCISMEELLLFLPDPRLPAPPVQPCDTPNGSDTATTITSDRIYKQMGSRCFRDYVRFGHALQKANFINSGVPLCSLGEYANRQRRCCSTVLSPSTQ